MTDDTRRPIPLADEHLALLRSGVGVSIASRSHDHLPNLMRAIGHRLEPSGEITVFVSRADAAGVLDDLRANGAIAVVFSQPTTNRTLQMKGALVTIAAASDADLRAALSCREATAAELQAVGFGSDFARHLLDFLPEDLVAVRFAPEAAFDQTPGPKAGAQLALRADERAR